MLTNLFPSCVLFGIAGLLLLELFHNLLSFSDTNRTHYSYWAFKNQLSMDGLPGMQRGVETAKKVDIKPIKKMVGAPAALLQSMQSRNDRPLSMSYFILAILASFSMGIVATLLVSLQMGFLQF
jgi:hypothetical protein